MRTVSGGTPSASVRSAQLDGLKRALDVEAMAVYLDRLLGGRRARLLSASLLEVKDGERAVVAYQVETDGLDGGHRLIGKLYSDPVRARRGFTLLTRLRAEVFGDGPLGVPEPIGHLPELDMVVYVAAEGRPLDRLSEIGRQLGVVAAARWLAVLHGSSLELDRRFDLETELANLAGWTGIVSDAVPSASADAKMLLGRVRDLAGRVALRTRTPIHKDFHYQHVLIGRRLVVVDLDEARWGDPAFDLAHFCANLRLLELRGAAVNGEVARLQHDFLADYSASTGWKLDDAYPLFHGYTCLKLARQLAIGRGPHPRPTGGERERQVRQILKSGLGMRVPFPGDDA